MIYEWKKISIILNYIIKYKKIYIHTSYSLYMDQNIFQEDYNKILYNYFVKEFLNEDKNTP